MSVTSKQSFALVFVALVCCQAFLPALAFPNPTEDARKFPHKSNVVKKTNAVDRIEKEDASSNAVSGNDNNGGFSWVNILGSLLQMFLGGGGGGGFDKSDSQGGFNWMNLVSMGARLLMSTMSGDNSIDKSDGGMPPALQAIQLVTSLLEALKMSFSQRSSEARSAGEKDTMADVGIASVIILKGYVNTMKSNNDVCAQKTICEANRDCTKETEGSGYFFCQIGTYAAGYAIEKMLYTPIERIADAGRKGRTGENCSELYYQCNEL